MPNNILKGQFFSVWENGTVSSYAELNKDTGEIIHVEMIDAGDDLGHLEREYFKDRAGIEYEICITCHEHTLKYQIEEGPTGKQLEESWICSNPDCESHN